MPTIFSKLWVPLAASFGLQLGAATVFVPLQSDKYYDLTGAVGHLACTVTSFYGPSLYKHLSAGGAMAGYRLPSLTTFAPRQLLITAALSIWAARLGSFLFKRIVEEGKDSRFDKIKTQPSKFFVFWVGQAAWISLVGMPIWLTNALPVSATRPLGPWDGVILAAAALSLGAEILADSQKSQWRKEKKEGKHNEQFITSGLWSISRHPNYVGEVGFQASLFALACRSLVAPGVPGIAVALAASSPLFTYLLLRYASGVPPLERSAKKRWGDDPAWKHYTKTTPVFWPWAPIYE